jgi:hypothetical protein
LAEAKGWSAYEGFQNEGFQNEAALRELLLASQLNPGVEHEDVAAISEHVGLVDLSDREMRLALNIDPTSPLVQDLPLTLYFLRASLDDWHAVHQRRRPGESLPAWYLLRRGRIDDAEQANLSVKPRSSVFRYKGKDTNPQTVAKELNVQSILNGRVVQRGQDISLFVEMIDVSSGRVVWSETYNRKSVDLVNLQADIARDVSGKTKSKLSGEDIAKVTKTYTTNPQAYQLYFRGNFYLTKHTEEGCQKGIEYHEKALAIDPKYALAYHGIAAAYDFANGFYLSPREAEPKAAALKALKLDDTLAETQYVWGKIVFWYEWDWTTAEREWRRAMNWMRASPLIRRICSRWADLRSR